MALLLAAGIAFLGSAAMMKAGRVFPALAGSALDAGRPGPLLTVLVVLLAVAGGILVALAGTELLELRRRRRGP